MPTTVAALRGGAMSANGHGERKSRASFWALTIGSVGVVYGDIGTSPLYAFREAVIAAVGRRHASPATPSSACSR